MFAGLDKEEGLMGDIHELLAWGLIVTAAIHAAGALKHHLIDRDTTLIRMLGTTPNEEETE